MENKKPFYKNKWVVIVAAVILIGLIFGNNGTTENKSSEETLTKPENESEAIEIPKKIELAEVKLLSDGYKVTCAFYKDFKYVKVKGKLKVEIYNWDMSDNVDYTDEDTYDLGIKLAEQEFEIDPSQLKKEIISYQFENKILSDSKPTKTYLTGRFTFTPDSDKSVNIVSGSSYQTL